MPSPYSCPDPLAAPLPLLKAAGFGAAVFFAAVAVPVLFFADDLFAVALREAALSAAGLRPPRFARALELAFDLLRLDFLAALPPRVLLEDLLVDLFFFATLIPSSIPPPGRSDHTIPEMSNRGEERIRITAGPAGLTVEIRPLVRTRRGRLRVALLASSVLAGALLGGARLGQAWEAGLKKGDFGDLSLPLLAALSLAVGVSTPLALTGLAALAFAEETIQVDRQAVTIRACAFEKARVRRIPIEEIECWRQTYLPLPPWWTWSVTRLAARSGGRLEALAGAAGPREKREIAQVLARATGRPLIDDFGRVSPGSQGWQPG